MNSSRERLVVVGALALITLVCVIGAVVLAVGGNDTPQFVVATGSAAAGALAGVLVPRAETNDADV